ncbi:hypothetical protein F8388_020741 [Cannabis sativa]|uniref:DNL-type domain-containing protein n=1 Tax=Cannabis sativa TaxID=3483 RepID=A0A7J6EXL4_CANSA|nr:hypothetical protein F8388_020741 [Cannabis sativa]
MAATTTTSHFYPPFHSHSFSNTDTHRPSHSNLCSNTHKPFSASKIYPSIILSRSSTKISAPKHVYKSLVVSGLVNGNSETHPELESTVSNSDATIDIKLPRRSLLVKFTCNLCGERTQKLVNRLAYERGLIYVQYHKLVDNLGLVVEYDLREEISADENKDEVLVKDITRVGEGAGAVSSLDSSAVGDGPSTGGEAGGLISGAGATVGGAFGAKSAGAGAGTSLAGAGAGAFLAGAGACGALAGVGDIFGAGKGGGKGGGEAAGGGVTGDTTGCSGTDGGCEGVETGETFGGCGGGSVGLTVGATLGDGEAFGVAATGGCVATTGGFVVAAGDTLGVDGVVVGKATGAAAGDCALFSATGMARQAKNNGQNIAAAIFWM